MVVSSIQTLHSCNVQSRSVYLDIQILLQCCTIDSLMILAVSELIYVCAASVALNPINFDKIPKFLFNFSLIKKNALPFSSHSIIVFRVTTHQNLKEKLVEESRALKRLIVYYDLVANFF